MKQFTIPIKLESIANKREHYHARGRRAKKQRADAKLVCPHFDGKCVVTITRIAPRKLDSDNLAISAKSIRDGIADRLGVNDGDDELVRWFYTQHKGPPKTYEVHVLLETPEEFLLRTSRDEFFVFALTRSPTTIDAITKLQEIA